MTIDYTHWVLQISSGTGPIEVRTFVASLATWFTTHSETLGFSVLERITYGDADSPRAIQLICEGRELSPDATGTYALICRSPSRQQHARKRWFAGVAVFPRRKLASGAWVDDDDVTYSSTRSSGPGGQNVNRRMTAVRATHAPSGITVRAESQRTQGANKKRALVLLSSALQEKARSATALSAKEERMHHHRVERGRATRTFRLDRRGRLIDTS